MRLPRARPPRDAASTASIGLAVAAALLAGAIGMATMMENKPAGVDPRKAQHDASATSALDVIVHDPGLTSDGVVSWAQTPDALTRFGLALPGQPNFVDYEKMASLRNGSLVADPTNHAPDYPEVKAALGITQGDFHLRTYPVLPSVGDPRFTADPNGRLAYVGHYTGEAASCSLNMTTGYARSPTALNVTATVRNDGDSACLAAVSFTMRRDTDTEKETVTEMNTLLLQPGSSQTVWSYDNKIHQWWTDYTRVDVDATDAFGNPAVDASGHRVGPVTVRQVAPNDESTSEDVYWVSAADRYVVQGAPVKFYLYAQDGQSQKASQQPASGRFVLYGPDGREWQNRTIAFNNASTDFMVVCANCTQTGNYVAKLYDSAVNYPKQDQVYVSPAKLFAGKNVPSSYASAEIAMLRTLVSQFNGTPYDATNAPQGDVFVDDVNGNTDLTSVLSRYSTVVVGSEISQNSLLAASFRTAVRDWVHAGGNLVVLGTQTQASYWLSDLYHSAQNNANGGISAPDTTHAILVSPNVLEYDRYLDNGRAWSVDASQPFTHVLTRGPSGATMQDTLTANAPGALGNGTVVLTSYMPAALTAPQDALEATRFLQNLLAQRYTMLFMDYGPPIPDGVPVGSDQRLVAVPCPYVPGAVVEVRLVMYMFG